MNFPAELNRRRKTVPCLGHIAVALICCAQVSLAQSGTQNRELVTSYVPIKTPFFKAHIPAPACRAIISQAIAATPDGLKVLDLKMLDERDLHTASVNLRVCATSSELARIERDLAIGLYGEAVSEIERREREKESNHGRANRNSAIPVAPD
jgi:hypothetical protein